MRILIAYASKGKTAEEYAYAIEEVLRERGLEPDVVNLMKGAIDPSKYDSIIVGFGVRAGRPYREAIDFLRHDFGGKDVSLFVSTLEPSKTAVGKYIRPVLAKNPTIKHLSAKVLGGRFKFIWKTVDKTNLEAARKWAASLSEKIK
jgi:menaquinone-dependent protoporphyrinogen IX oxidase